MNAKKTVLIACGTGIATSTVVSTVVQKIANENDLNVDMVLKLSLFFIFQGRNYL